jgi:hypothetical protein
MRQTLFPTAGSNRTSLSAAGQDGVGIPLILRIGVVRGIAAVASDEQLAELSRQLEDPIFGLVVKRSRGARDPNRGRPSLKFEALGLPASPFVTCNLPEIARLARGIAYRKRDIHGTSRPFIEISPPYHALALEIASVVNPKSWTICLDLRMSGKGVIPSAVVSFNVPENLTPPQIPEWAVTNLVEGVKVTHRFSFTVGSASNPFVQITVMQEGAIVLQLKVCLPLIDLFVKIARPEGPVQVELEKAIWQRLRYEQPDVDLEDAIWVDQSGCIAVKNHIARSSKKAFLDMLPSAIETRAVLD